MDFPVHQLERIFHIDNRHQHSREELKAEIKHLSNTHDILVDYVPHSKKNNTHRY